MFDFVIGICCDWGWVVDFVWGVFFQVSLRRRTCFVLGVLFGVRAHMFTDEFHAKDANGTDSKDKAVSANVIGQLVICVDMGSAVAFSNFVLPACVLFYRGVVWIQWQRSFSVNLPLLGNVITAVGSVCDQVLRLCTAMAQFRHPLDVMYHIYDDRLWVLDDKVVVPLNSYGDGVIPPNGCEMNKNSGSSGGKMSPERSPRVVATRNCTKKMRTRSPTRIPTEEVDPSETQSETEELCDNDLRVEAFIKIAKKKKLLGIRL